jgi:transposase-like protein
VQKKDGHKWAFEYEAQEIGDAYTFIALESKTKLVLAWHLGKRNTENTTQFIRKLRRATADAPFELCTDAFGSYVPAVAEVLYDRAHYSQVAKVYSKREEGRSDTVQGNSSPSKKPQCGAIQTWAAPVHHTSSARMGRFASGASA